jgi:hypothetical protein
MPGDWQNYWNGWRVFTLGVGWTWEDNCRVLFLDYGPGVLTLWLRRPNLDIGSEW